MVGYPTLIRNGEWDTPLPDWQHSDLLLVTQDVDTEAFDSYVSLICIISSLLSIAAGVSMENRTEAIIATEAKLQSWFAGISNPRISRIVSGNDAAHCWGTAHMIGGVFQCARIITARFQNERYVTLY